MFPILYILVQEVISQAVNWDISGNGKIKTTLEHQYKDKRNPALCTCSEKNVSSKHLLFREFQSFVDIFTVDLLTSRKGCI